MPPRAVRFALAGSVLAVLACGLNAVGLGDHGLWMPDEPREAEIAREFAGREDWVVPWMNGGRWLEKPPLYHWAAAWLFRRFGAASPFLARLPSAASGVLIGACAWILARRLGPRGLAPWAAFLAWTSAELLNAAHSAMVDALFAALVTLAVTCAVLLPSGTGAILTAFLAGLAFLAKAHLGPVLVGGAVLGWIAVTGRRQPLRRLLSPLPVLVFLATAGTWPALLYVRQHAADLFHQDVARLLGQGDPGATMGRDALAEVLWGQLLTRAGGGALGHAQPFWYYLPALLTFAAPASLALVAALPWGLSRLRRADPLAALCIAWLASALIVLSLPSCKRVIYLTPCVVPAALLAAHWGRAALARAEASGRLRGAALALGGLALAASAALSWLGRSLAGTPLPAEAGSWALLLGAAAWGAVALAALGHPRAAGTALAAWLLLGALAADAVLVPALDRRESFAGLAAELKRQSRADRWRTIEGYRLSENLQGAVAFALGRRVRTFSEPEPLLDSLRAGNRLVLMPLDEYEKLEADPRSAGLLRKAAAREAAGICFVIAASTHLTTAASPPPTRPSPPRRRPGASPAR